MLLTTRRAKLLASIAMSAAWLLPASAGHAADIQERTLRLSTAGNKGSPHDIGAKKFAELVSAKSGGKITVKTFLGGVLGPDLQNYSAMQGGTLDFNISNASYLAGNVKELAIFDFPSCSGRRRRWTPSRTRPWAGGSSTSCRSGGWSASPTPTSASATSTTAAGRSPRPRTWPA
jgi:hypothetical protein